MQRTEEKLIIVGAGEFGEIAYEYAYDSPHEVAPFSVEKDFLKRKELFGFPLFRGGLILPLKLFKYEGGKSVENS